MAVALDENNKLVYADRLVTTTAIQQIGKPYDKAAVIGMPINRDWQQDTDWLRVGKY